MGARILLVSAGLAFVPQEPDAVELKSMGVPTPARANLRLDGRASALPNGTLLNALLLRVEERAMEGRLFAHEAQHHSEMVRVETGKFAYAAPTDCPPGSYRVVVRLSEGMQRVRPLQLLKEAGTAMPREWSLPCSAWGDDQAGRMGWALGKVDGLAAEAKNLVAEFERAGTHRDRWEGQCKDLDAKAGKLMDRVSRSEERKLLTAAGGEIVSALGELRANASRIQFQANGAFAGFSDYHDQGKPPKFQGEDFGWGVVSNYLGKIPVLAGREFALWAVKDIRRAGRVTESLTQAIREQAKHPGASSYADPLLKGEGLDELEKEIRKKPE